jgi:hypothetical protein
MSDPAAYWFQNHAISAEDSAGDAAWTVWEAPEQEGSRKGYMSKTARSFEDAGDFVEARAAPMSAAAVGGSERMSEAVV